VKSSREAGKRLLVFLPGKALTFSIALIDSSVWIPRESSPVCLKLLKTVRVVLYQGGMDMFHEPAADAERSRVPPLNGRLGAYMFLVYGTDISWIHHPQCCETFRSWRGLFFLASIWP